VRLLALKKDAAPGTLVYYKADSRETFVGTVVDFPSSFSGKNYVNVRWMHSGNVGTCELHRVYRLIMTFAGPAWKGEGRLVFSR
jgi:hypothetical protein